MTNLAIFLSGYTMATFVASSLFFLKFWRASRDRFFLWFAVACSLIAIERMAGLIYNPLFSGTDQMSEAAVYVYSIRLVAFLMLLVGIWEKNRPNKNSIG